MRGLDEAAGYRTERGGRRANQDAVVAVPVGRGRELVAVADGMGGHTGGSVASRLALETLAVRLRRGDTLAEAVRVANVAVHRAAHERPELQGMGTTLVALVRHGTAYEVANVGDSRAYRVGPEGIRQITRDHSFLAEAQERGELAAEEASRSPWRHAVTRALGLDAEVEVDLFGPFRARPPHYVLLCSDGLSNVLSVEELRLGFADDPPAAAVADRLCAAALASGASDNVTAAVVRFGERGTARGRIPDAARRRPALSASIWHWRIMQAAVVVAAALLLLGLAVLLTLQG